MPATRRSSGATVAAVTAKPTARRTSTAKKSKTVEDMIPPTCTPFFVPPPPPMLPEPSSSGPSEPSTDLRRRTLKGKVRAKMGETEELTELSADDKSRLLQELLGFHPRTVVEDISEACRKEIYSIAGSIDHWAEMTHGRPVGTTLTEEEASDLEQGPHRLETLLESHMDSACDKFTAWCLRNTFNIPDDLRLVLPWHKGLDFDRANFVATSAEGEDGVQSKIDDLRTQVVEMRKLKHQLDLANKKLDKQVQGLELEKQAAGFVLDLAEESGLSPLPAAADALSSVLGALASKLETFDTIVPTPQPVDRLPEGSGSSGSGTKVWEYGRAAYLNWAASLPSEGGTDITAGETDKAERERIDLDRMKKEVQGVTDAETLGKLEDSVLAER